MQYVLYFFVSIFIGTYNISDSYLRKYAVIISFYYIVDPYEKSRSLLVRNIFLSYASCSLSMIFLALVVIFSVFPLSPFLFIYTFVANVKIMIVSI